MTFLRAAYFKNQNWKKKKFDFSLNCVYVWLHQPHKERVRVLKSRHNILFALNRLGGVIIVSNQQCNKSVHSNHKSPVANTCTNSNSAVLWLSFIFSLSNDLHVQYRNVKEILYCLSNSELTFVCTV